MWRMGGDLEWFILEFYRQTPGFFQFKSSNEHDGPFAPSYVARQKSNAFDFC